MKQKLIHIIILFNCFLILGCNISNSKKEVDKESDSLRKNLLKEINRDLSQTDILNNSREIWKTLNINDISELSSNKEFFRFTLCRSFKNNFCIEINKDNHDYKIFWREWSFCPENGKLEQIKQKSKKIKTFEWLEINKYIDNSCFWSLKPGNRIICFDCSTWIIEGKDSSRYHIINRAYINPEDSLYKFCDKLIKMTDIKNDIKE